MLYPEVHDIHIIRGVTFYETRYFSQDGTPWPDPDPSYTYDWTAELDDENGNKLADFVMATGTDSEKYTIDYRLSSSVTNALTQDQGTWRLRCRRTNDDWVWELLRGSVVIDD